MKTTQPINLGLIGFGTVGTGVVKYFQQGGGEPHGIRLKRVAVSELKKPRELHFPYVTDEVRDLLNDPDIKVVVELMGGEDPAKEYILQAIDKRKSVVTGNKVVLSRHMKLLFEAAREMTVDLAFEASVAGAIPIIRILNGYRGEGIFKISGILNGTSNYILSRMEDGMDFTSALRLALERGFAEAEHSLDTGGFDARDKLAIIASLAYNTPVDPATIYCEGITGLTPVDLDFAGKYGVEEGETGYAIKSLATARMNQNLLELHVYPALISKEHPLAAVKNEYNAVYVHGELSGPQIFQGRGAGRNATASAIISNILRTAENLRKGVVDELPTLDSKVEFADVHSLERRGYVRMNLKHVPGSIAEASRIMAQHGFNIEDSIQRRRFQYEVGGEKVIPDIVTAEPLPYRTVESALRDLQDCRRLEGEPFYLRFEE